MATSTAGNMPTSTAAEIEKVKISIATYFGSQHECVANTRKFVKNLYQISVDGVTHIEALTANGQMRSALEEEEHRRYKLKNQIALMIKCDDVDNLPNEEQGSIGDEKNIQAQLESPHGDILKRMGTALREIDETKVYMTAFLSSHITKETFLHSAWDMEMYKLQNAYTILKKRVLQDWKPASTLF
jgi:hypothetical protein